ncbi:MAG: hypothetical protein ACM339_12100 [Ignavibacteria bacterium]
MKKAIIILFILCTAVLSGQTDSTSKPAPEPVYSVPQQSEPSRIYLGGTVSFSFWNDYFYLGLFPMIGYQFSNKFTAGIRVGYAYLNDDRYSPALKSDNYGGGVFAQYSIIPQIYAKSELLYCSFERVATVTLTNYTTERVGVPLLLLGAGYNHQISRNASVFVEFMWDVIQDDNSPFPSGEPFISFGAGVGL